MLPQTNHRTCLLLVSHLHHHRPTASSQDSLKPSLVVPIKLPHRLPAFESLPNTSDKSCFLYSKLHIHSPCWFPFRWSLFIPIFPRPWTTGIMIFISLRRKLRLGTVMLFGWVLVAESTQPTPNSHVFALTAVALPILCWPTWCTLKAGPGASSIVASTVQGLAHSECMSQSWGPDYCLSS